MTKCYNKTVQCTSHVRNHEASVTTRLYRNDLNILERTFRDYNGTKGQQMSSVSNIRHPERNIQTNDS